MEVHLPDQNRDVRSRGRRRSVDLGVWPCSTDARLNVGAKATSSVSGVDHERLPVALVLPRDYSRGRAAFRVAFGTAAVRPSRGQRLGYRSRGTGSSTMVVRDLLGEG